MALSIDDFNNRDKPRSNNSKTGNANTQGLKKDEFEKQMWALQLLDTNSDGNIDHNEAKTAKAQNSVTQNGVLTDQGINATKYDKDKNRMLDMKELTVRRFDKDGKNGINTMKEKAELRKYDKNNNQIDDRLEKFYDKNNNQIDDRLEKPTKTKSK